MYSMQKRLFMEIVLSLCLSLAMCDTNMEFGFLRMSSSNMFMLSELHNLWFIIHPRLPRRTKKPNVRFDGSN